MSKLIVFVAAAFGIDAIPVFPAGNGSSPASGVRAWPAGGKPDAVVAGDPPFFLDLAGTAVGRQSVPDVPLRVTPGG